MKIPDSCIDQCAIISSDIMIMIQAIEEAKKQNQNLKNNEQNERNTINYAIRSMFNNKILRFNIDFIKEIVVMGVIINKNNMMPIVKQYNVNTLEKYIEEIY